MTIDPAVRARHDAAYDSYTEARAQMVKALHEIVVATALDAFPSAGTLVILGEFAEDGFILRAQSVLDTEGSLLAGYDDDDSHTDEWDAFTDTVDGEFLDFLGELTGDDYLGESEIDLTVPEDPTVILILNLMASSDPDTSRLGTLLANKRLGTDCNEDDSAFIMRMVDVANANADSELDSLIADIFPLEHDQWYGERSDGHR